MSPLITNVNNPKVKSVTGNVKMTKIGFTMVFPIAKTTATTRAATKSFNIIPDFNIYAVINTANPRRSNLKIIFMNIVYNTTGNRQMPVPYYEIKQN